MAALVKPFGMCAEVLNPVLATEIFRPGLDKAFNYIEGLEEKDFKEKVCGVFVLMLYFLFFAGTFHVSVSS